MKRKFEKQNSIMEIQFVIFVNYDDELLSGRYTGLPSFFVTPICLECV